MAHDTSELLKGKSIYQIFIRNHCAKGTFDAALPSLVAVKKMGFDFVYLTPVHPSGKVARKGTLGSPYAISDYRAVDPALGGVAGFRRFIDATHKEGLKIIIDVVYNHTSPDSVLVKEHPEWFWKGADGKPGPRVADWSDVVDLDYSIEALWDYQIETLEKWVRFGVDGFRCDVASLVPVDFWVEARRRIAALPRHAGSGARPCLWLAESVHKEFVATMRSKGFYAASDAELHQAFDLTYDYDSRHELDGAWAGSLPLSAYLHHLGLQACMYPATAIKARFLENHDQPRIAGRVGLGARLRNWTVFAMLLDGTFFAYAGQERGIANTPSLFNRDPVDWKSGEDAFEAWFGAAHRATKAVRKREPGFAAREIAAGVVLLERTGGTRPVRALLNLDGRSGTIHLPAPLGGRDILTRKRVSLEGTVALCVEPLVVELE